MLTQHIQQNCFRWTAALVAMMICLAEMVLWTSKCVRIHTDSMPAFGSLYLTCGLWHFSAWLEAATMTPFTETKEWIWFLGITQAFCWTRRYRTNCSMQQQLTMAAKAVTYVTCTCSCRWFLIVVFLQLTSSVSFFLVWQDTIDLGDGDVGHIGWSLDILCLQCCCGCV